MKRIQRGSLAAVSVLMTAALVVSACSASGDKSGVPTQPISLVLANSDGQTNGIPAIERFIERVHTLSGGRVEIDVRSQWGGERYDEAGLIRDVAARRADLGWSGTRAFDLVGVQAFRPIHVPFLVDSLAAESAIINDPLTRTMLDSVQTAGVTGLALMADEIRHPVGADKPLLEPADFRGITFRSYPSGAQADGIRALGAIPTTDAIVPMIERGQLGGFESMWWTLSVNSLAAAAPYVSANVDLWPRTTVLFANPFSLAGMDQQARDWVTAAAEEASEWSTIHALDGQDYEMHMACAQSARVATASDAQLAALRRAAEPVYADLRADETVSPTLDRIERLVADAPDDPPVKVPEDCVYRPGEEARRTSTLVAPATAPGDPGALPQGVYRFSMTEDFLLGKGVSSHDAFVNAGVWTWTLDRGRWHSRQEPIDPSVTMLDCDGYYDVRGSTVTFTRTTNYVAGDCAPPTWTAAWTATPATLTWTDVSVTDGFQYMWAPRTWARIG